MKVFVVAVLLVAAVCGVQSSCVKFGIGWEERADTGNCYKFFKDEETWQTGLEACQSEGGALVSINDYHENEWIRTFSHDGDKFKVSCGAGLIGTDHTRYWIGLKKDGGTWNWVDGSGHGYMNWKGIGGPNGRDKCAFMEYSDGKWDNEDCDEPLCILCEAIP